MKLFTVSLLLAICTLLSTGCASPSISTTSCNICKAPIPPGETAPDIYNDVQAFHHHGLHAQDEAYLVRVDSAELTGGGKNQYRMMATILKQVKGRRAVGSKLEILRVSDAGSEMVRSWMPKLAGETQYVFLFTAKDGGYIIDQQSPHTTWPPKPEYSQIIRRHSQICRSRH